MGQMKTLSCAHKELGAHKTRRRITAEGHGLLYAYLYDSLSAARRAYFSGEKSIGSMYVESTFSTTFASPCWDLIISWKCRVGLKGGPVVLRLIAVGVGQDIDERVVGGRCVDGRPIANGLQVVLREPLRNLLSKLGLQRVRFAGNRVIDAKFEDAIGIGSDLDEVRHAGVNSDPAAKETSATPV